MIFKKLPIFFISLIFLESCSNNLSIKRYINSSTPQILFIQVLVKNNIDQTKIKGKLEKVILKNGLLKVSNNPNWADNQKWRIQFLNIEKEVLQTVYESDVLKERHEYLTENNEFKEVVINNKEAQLFVRVPFQNDYQWIKIDRKTKNNTIENIELFKLK